MKIDLSIKDASKKKKAEEGLAPICEWLKSIMPIYRRATEDQKAKLREHNSILDKILDAVGGIE